MRGGAVSTPSGRQSRAATPMSSSASNSKKSLNLSEAPAKPTSASVVALPIAEQKKALAAAFGTPASAARAAAAPAAPSAELLHLTAALGEGDGAAKSRPRKERFLIALILPLAIVIGGLARDLTALNDRPGTVAEPRRDQPVTLDYPSAAAAAATGEPINPSTAPELALAQIAASLATLKPAAGPAQPREDVLTRLAAALPEPTAAPVPTAVTVPAAEGAAPAPRKIAVATPAAAPTAPTPAALAPAASAPAQSAAAAKPAAAPKPTVAAGGRFYVQFGAFRVEEYAREDCAAMAALTAVVVTHGSGANALMTCRTVDAMSEQEATALVARAHEKFKHEAILVPEAKHAVARGGAVAAVDR